MQIAGWYLNEIDDGLYKKKKYLVYRFILIEA